MRAGGQVGSTGQELARPELGPAREPEQPVVVDEIALQGWLGRRADEADTTRSALLDALLDACELGVFVVDEGGAVVLTNPAGARLLEREADALTPLLRAEGTWSEATSAASGERLRAWRRRLPVEGAPRELVIVDAEEGLVERSLSSAAEAWSLTDAQREVLRLTLEGLPREELEAALGAPPEAVDAHLGSLLEKASVTSRVALVSRVYRLPRPGRL